MSLHEDMVAIGKKSLVASRQLILLNARKKKAILEAMADELMANRQTVLDANGKDMQEGENAGLTAAMLDRLRLTEARIDSMVKGLRSVAVLKDPIGSKISRWIRPNGLEINFFFSGFPAFSLPFGSFFAFFASAFFEAAADFFGLVGFGWEDDFWFPNWDFLVTDGARWARIRRSVRRLFRLGLRGGGTPRLLLLRLRCQMPNAKC